MARSSITNLSIYALSARIIPPFFDLYAGGECYGPHVDGAIRALGRPDRVRTDLSATLFLSEDYDGGELVIRDSNGEHGMKLPAGDLILYSGTSIHHVAPMTAGSRIAAFFWIQSMVRDAAKRTMLYDLDATIQSLEPVLPAGNEATLGLAQLYNNLMRLWAEV